MEIQQNMKLGQTFDFSLTHTDTFCSCFTKNNTRCQNKHKMLFKLSNNTMFTTCSIPAHKKHVMQSFLINGVTANVFRLIHSHEVNQDMHLSTYTVCGVSVDSTCNSEYPVIKPFETISKLKQSIKNDIHEYDNELTSCRSEIDNLKKYLQHLMKEMKDLQTGRFELSKALNYVRMNAVFNPPKNSPGDDNLICCICYELMSETDAGSLYECKHAFHFNCIQKWFGRKDVLTCPCCRTNCSHDNYFVFKT